ncbi:hypothetical protein LINGRAHAP2_LOCUS31413, partial [Linum grandiflorum]
NFPPNPTPFLFPFRRPPTDRPTTGETPSTSGDQPTTSLPYPNPISPLSHQKFEPPPIPSSGPISRLFLSIERMAPKLNIT